MAPRDASHDLRSVIGCRAPRAGSRVRYWIFSRDSDCMSMSNLPFPARQSSYPLQRYHTCKLTSHASIVVGAGGEEMHASNTNKRNQSAFCYRIRSSTVSPTDRPRCERKYLPCVYAGGWYRGVGSARGGTPVPTAILPRSSLHGALNGPSSSQRHIAVSRVHGLIARWRRWCRRVLEHVLDRRRRPWHD